MSAATICKNPQFLRAFAKSLHQTGGMLHEAGAPLRATGPLFTAAKELENWAQSIEKQQENNRSNVLPFRKPSIANPGNS